MGNGAHVRIEVDPIIGGSEWYKLSPGIIRHLNFFGFFVLTHVHNQRRVHWTQTIGSIQSSSAWVVEMHWNG